MEETKHPPNKLQLIWHPRSLVIAQVHLWSAQLNETTFATSHYHEQWAKE